MRHLDFDLDSNYSNLRPAKPISSADIEQAQKDLQGALSSDSPIIQKMAECVAEAKAKYGQFDVNNPSAEIKAFLDQCNASKSSTTPAEQRSEELKLKSEAQNKMALLGILAIVGIFYVVSKKSL